MRTRSRRRSPGSAGNSPRSAGPWALALRRLRRDRAALTFGALFAADRARAARGTAVRERGGAHHRRRRTTSPTRRRSTASRPTSSRSTVSRSAPPGSAEYFLGADDNGRDLMVRLLYGARASLDRWGSAPWCSRCSSAIPLGARGRLPARAHGRGHQPAVRPALVVPGAAPRRPPQHRARRSTGWTSGPFAIGSGSKLIPIVVIGLVYVPYVARPLRGQVLALREQQFVEAARASGMRRVGGDGLGAAAAPLGHAARALDAPARERRGARGGAVVPRRRHRPARAIARHADRRRVGQGRARRRTSCSRRASRSC